MVGEKCGSKNLSEWQVATKVEYAGTGVRMAAFLIVALGTAMIVVSPELMGSGKDDITIEIMAAKPSWTASEYVGHAFLCVGVPTSSGIKEDCFGFYPKTDEVFIGGPSGIVANEFAQNPKRFARITRSIKRTISKEQRVKLYEAINKWNKTKYSLTDHSCIDFVDEIAKMLGWKRQPRGATDLPEAYLEKLTRANSK